MENRRLYFDRSKRLLGKVRALVFLSKIRAEQWQDWASKEKISLPSRSSIVSLSVNDAVLSAAEQLDNSVGTEAAHRIGRIEEQQDGVLLNFLHQHPTLAESVLWTPASVSVSALYAAADAYLMNAQGIGETFGRVTVEAMAFGLPILGTDAGGTKEIVDANANATGFLHPAGAKGATTLSENILALLRVAEAEPK